MFTNRNILMFFAGFEFFHTLSHILLPYYVKLPLKTSLITFTKTRNVWAIVINAAITIILLWYAKKAKK